VSQPVSMRRATAADRSKSRTGDDVETSWRRPCPETAASSLGARAARFVGRRGSGSLRELRSQSESARRGPIAFAPTEKPCRFHRRIVVLQHNPRARNTRVSSERRAGTDSRSSAAGTTVRRPVVEPQRDIEMGFAREARHPRSISDVHHAARAALSAPRIASANSYEPLRPRRIDGTTTTDVRRSESDRAPASVAREYSQWRERVGHRRVVASRRERARGTPWRTSGENSSLPVKSMLARARRRRIETVGIAATAQNAHRRRRARARSRAR